MSLNWVCFDCSTYITKLTSSKRTNSKMSMLILMKCNFLGTELTEAKEKLSRADSSSDESDEEGAQKRKKIEMADKPTEEMVEKLEEKLEAANVDQKRLFLIVFQRFIMILSEHLLRCDTDGQDYDNDWYRWTIGRLQQVFLVVRNQIPRMNSLIIQRKEFCLIYHFLSLYSITNRCRSIAAHWKHFCLLQSSIRIHLMCSNSSLLYGLKSIHQTKTERKIRFDFPKVKKKKK